MSIYKNALKTHSILFLLLLIVSNGNANDSNINLRYQVKDGLAIYIGLVPAEMIEGINSKSMHGGLPVGTYRYHIAVAIFNHNTGKRVNNANVTVSINNLNGIGLESSKRLENMSMNNKNMYGNYFSLKSSGPYKIRVNIRQGGNKAPINIIYLYNLAHT